MAINAATWMKLPAKKKTTTIPWQKISKALIDRSCRPLINVGSLKNACS